MHGAWLLLVINSARFLAGFVLIAFVVLQEKDPLMMAIGGTEFPQPVVPLTAWTDRPAFMLMLLAMVVISAGMFQGIRKRARM